MVRTQIIGAFSFWDTSQDYTGYLRRKPIFLFLKAVLVLKALLVVNSKATILF
jgi:hypothetical protein